MATQALVRLNDYFAGFVEKQVDEGRFGSATDVVEARLRLLEEREAKLEALRAALIAGEKSDVAEDFDFDVFMEEKFGAHSASE